MVISFLAHQLQVVATSAHMQFVEANMIIDSLFVGFLLWLVYRNLENRIQAMQNEINRLEAEVSDLSEKLEETGLQACDYDEAC